MPFRELFLIALLMVSIWGLSISPNQMKAVEFRPKKSFFEKKKPEIMAVVSVAAGSVFGSNIQIVRVLFPLEYPVLPQAKTVFR